MRRASLVGSIVVLCVAAAFVGEAQPRAGAPSAPATAPAPSLSQLLGFVDSRLVRVDSATLLPLQGKGLAVGSGGCAPRSGGTACWTNPAWTTSPNGKELAVARNESSSLAVVGATSLRVTMRMKFEGGSIGALTWPAPTRVVAIQETAGERQRVVAFDLKAKRIVARRALNGTVTRLERTPRGLVLLLAPAETIGEARIALVNSSGSVRHVGLKRILAGTKLLEGGGHRVDARQPGLAVDQQGRAFVVANELVAEIDLRTLTVAYHELEKPQSMLSRLWGWLEPAAHAKQAAGYYRQAIWVSDGRLVVSGTDSEELAYKPFGLRFVDTRDWRSRMIDDDAGGFRAADDVLLVNGIGSGLAAYGVDGAKRFQLFAGEQTWVAQVYGGRAYVGAGNQRSLRVVDLSTGAVVATREEVLPTLLLGPAGGWWDD